MRRLLHLLHALAWSVFLANLVTHRRRPAPPRRGSRRISVLIPARNEAANLRRLLPSLLAQDYPETEIIVYDDGSTDGTGMVARSYEGVRVIRGEGPPEGWLGKNHALYQATRQATGEVLLFLDADAELVDSGALGRLVARWDLAEARSGGRGGVLSGSPQWTGGGMLLVSLVPFAQWTALPMALIPRTRIAKLSALNGQVWMISAEAYRRERPHEALRDAVLEDVEIGRLMKRRGLRLELADMGGEVRVAMYGSHREAWLGFRKNVYLLQGGTPAAFAALHGAYAWMYVFGPLRYAPRLLLSGWALKALSDRRMRLPRWISAVAPLSILLSVLLPLDSAMSHWTGRVRWKGRSVGRHRPRNGSL